jgi:dihydropteroate synthase
MILSLRDYRFDLGRRPYVMGVLNVTPDSFWDGGKYAGPDRAFERARQMVAEGADIIDVGGESTRPGSEPLDVHTEIDRVAPVVKKILGGLKVPVSVDTRKAPVAKEMLELGVHMVNDISGLSFDPSMAGLITKYDVPVVVMHMRGTPENMQSFTDYEDVVIDVMQELREKVVLAEARGIAPRNIVVDPGIGFSKTAEQCVEIIARLDEFLDIGKPILVGPSRKSFIGRTLGLEPEERLEPTIACCLVAASRGASILRVHDVGSASRALRMIDRIHKWLVD